MIVNIEESSVEHFGDVRSLGSFGIEMTAKTASVLSSNIYRDKARAILREIGANAYDAHIDKDIADRPIEIHLPTILEPYLGFRDYGYGISPDGMIVVYRRYFSSTKTKTNKLIGTLGLGSKAPLSKVNAFTSISIFEGVKRTYDVFRNSEGIPDLVQRGLTEIVAPIEVERLAWLMAFEPVINVGNREEDGFEVIIPVTQQSEYAEYTSKAAEVFRHYPVPPKFIGVQPEIKPGDVLVEGSGWRLMADRSSAVAVMGIVPYTITPDCFDGISDLDSEERANLTKIINSGFEIDFAVGDVDFTPGREDLSYDRRTAQRVVAALRNIRDELGAEIEKQFSDCKTLRDAKHLYWKIFRDETSDFKVGNILGPQYPIHWREHVLTSHQIQLDLKDSSLIIQQYATKHTKKGVRRHTVTYSARHEDKELLASANRNGLFVVRDMETGFKARIYQWYHVNPGRDLYVVSGSPEQIAELETLFEGWEFGKLSDIPKVRRFPTTKSGEPIAKVLRLTDEAKTARYLYDPRQGYHWKKDEIDPTTKRGYYVVANRGRVEHWEMVKKFVLEGERFGLHDQTYDLYAVTKTEATRLAKHGWKDFLTAMSERVHQRMESVLESQRLRAAVDRFHATGVHGTALVDVSKLVPSSHPLNRLRREYEKLNALPSLAAFRDMIVYAKIDLTGKERHLTDKWDKLVATYPALPYLMRQSTPSEIVCQYIELLDRSNQNA